MDWPNKDSEVPEGHPSGGIVQTPHIDSDICSGSAEIHFL